ncbi:hypothetical protein DFH08DRAFT_390120 [Mycena albidolilacea]|uniref:Uncharacterized protein n=1 Tax=Mycena albidolilacea TaxID=1033008 RepID=A0AAD6ZEH2_9AGAR|nr:hypothetical protein DFH08DRAFT_390120 [Mycena albidolilacea]
MPSRKKAATTKARTTARATTKKSTTASKTEAKKETPKRPHSPDNSSDSQEETETPSEVEERPQKRVKKAIEETVPAPAPEPVGPIPSGKFDLYAMELPFLAKVYLPAGQNASAPQFDVLYDTILTYQAKPDSTARCVIPDAPFTQQGRLSSAVFEDPMEGMPWEIALDDMRVADPLVFPAAERKKFASPAPQTGCGAGIQGRTVLVDSDHCGVASAEGVFRMQRVWTEERGGKGVELWEGYLSFNVVHSGLYKRKRHGAGQKLGFAFWGVRGRKDGEGKEIGLNLE